MTTDHIYLKNGDYCPQEIVEVFPATTLVQLDSW